MMKISHLILIIILFLGCARHLRVYSKGCDIPAVWLDHNQNEADFSFEYKIYGNTLGFDATRVNIIEVLKKKKFICEEIETLSIETKQSAFDIVAGFIPFLSRTTLRVEGTYKRTEKEAIEVDSYGKQRMEFDSDFKKLQKRLQSESQ